MTMNEINVQRYRWSTSSFGSTPDTSPLELAILGDHFHRCEGKRRLAVDLEQLGCALGQFVALRLFTTVGLLAIVSTVVAMLW